MYNTLGNARRGSHAEQSVSLIYRGTDAHRRKQTAFSR